MKRLLVAAQCDKKYLEMEDFEKAKDKVMMGSERKVDGDF
jgi:cell division protease FtsH